MNVRWSSLPIVLTALLLSACSQTVELRPSALTPAAAKASAKLALSRADTGEALVEVRVKNLVSPPELEPPRLHYVVWAETADGRRSQLGRLLVDEDGRGAVMTRTAWDQLRVRISAEDLMSPSQPSSETVFVSDLFEVR